MNGGRPGVGVLTARGSDLPAALAVCTRHRDSSVLITVAGELDLFTAPRLWAELETAAARHLRGVVIDLSDVTFLDTVALGVLVGAHRTVALRGGSLRLVCVRPLVLKVLRITGLDRVIAVHDTVESALATVERARPDLVRPAGDVVPLRARGSGPV